MTELTTMTSDIAIAFVSNNNIAPNDVPILIASIHGALSNLDAPAPAAAEAPRAAAVSIRASVKPDAITCLECGFKGKMLKRHLRTEHSMDEHEYRKRWSLPSDYPMVAPNYSEKRRQLAKDSGLGRKPVRK